MVYQELEKGICGSNKSQKLGIYIHPINTPSPYKHKNKGNNGMLLGIWFRGNGLWSKATYI